MSQTNKSCAKISENINSLWQLKSNFTSAFSLRNGSGAIRLRAEMKRVIERLSFARWIGDFKSDNIFSLPEGEAEIIENYRQAKKERPLTLTSNGAYIIIPYENIINVIRRDTGKYHNIEIFEGREYSGVLSVEGIHTSPDSKVVYITMSFLGDQSQVYFTRLFDIKSGKCLGEISDGDKTIFPLKDGIVAGSWSRGLKKYSLNSESKLTGDVLEYSGNEYPDRQIKQLAVTDDGWFTCAVNDQGTVYVYNNQTMELTDDFGFNGANVDRIYPIPNSRKVACIVRQEEVPFDVTSVIIKELGGPSQRLTMTSDILALSSDGRFLIAPSPNNSRLQIYDLKSLEVVNRIELAKINKNINLRKNNARTIFLSVTPDRNILVAFSDGTIHSIKRSGPVIPKRPKPWWKFKK